MDAVAVASSSEHNGHRQTEQHFAMHISEVSLSAGAPISGSVSESITDFQMHALLFTCFTNTFADSSQRFNWIPLWYRMALAGASTLPALPTSCQNWVR